MRRDGRTRERTPLIEGYASRRGVANTILRTEDRVRALQLAPRVGGQVTINRIAGGRGGGGATGAFLRVDGTVDSTGIQNFNAGLRTDIIQDLGTTTRIDFTDVFFLPIITAGGVFNMAQIVGRLAVGNPNPISDATVNIDQDGAVVTGTWEPWVHYKGGHTYNANQGTINAVYYDIDPTFIGFTVTKFTALNMLGSVVGGTFTDLNLMDFSWTLRSGAAVTNWRGVNVSTPNMIAGTSCVTRWGIHVRDQGAPAVTIGTVYGIAIDDITSGTSRFPFYQAGTNGINKLFAATRLVNQKLIIGADADTFFGVARVEIWGPAAGTQIRGPVILTEEGSAGLFATADRPFDIASILSGTGMTYATITGSYTLTGATALVGGLSVIGQVNLAGAVLTQYTGLGFDPPIVGATAATTVIGIRSAGSRRGGGNTVDWAAFQAARVALVAGSTITNKIGFDVIDMGLAGITNLYGLRVLNQTAGTNIFPIYQEGPAGYNLFGSPSRFTLATANVLMGANAAAATSAVLELQTVTGSLLVSRMTTTQRNALTAVDGMVLYNSTTAQMQGRVAAAWVDLGAGAAGGGAPGFSGAAASVLKTTINWLGYGTGSVSATEADQEFYVPRAGTVRQLRVYVSASTTTSNTIITIRLNGANTALTVTFGAGVIGLQADVANSFAVVAGDRIAIQVDNQSAGGGARTITIETVTMELV